MISPAHMAAVIRRGMIPGRGGASALAADPTFDLYPRTSGVALLPAALTINGVTETPDGRYKGGDATQAIWSAWGYGVELAIVNRSTDPAINDGSPLLGDEDDSVRLTNGDHYVGDVGDLATEDAVIELFFRMGSSGILLARRQGGTGNGWLVYRSGSSLAFWINDGSGATQVNTAAGQVVTGAWYHAILFANRDGFAQWYVNGVASGAAVDISSNSGTTTTTDNLSIGAYVTGLTATNASIALASIYKRDGWLDTHLQADVAADRFEKVSGIWLARARGTRRASFTRSSAGYLDKVESGGRRLYYMGAGWPRVCSRPDTSGDARTGYLSERSTLNLFTYNRNISAYWSKTNCTVVGAVEPSPDPHRDEASELKETAFVSIYHVIQRGASLTDGVQYCTSLYVKPINRTEVRLAAVSAPTAYAFFVLSGAGSIGTTSATDDQGVEQLDDGWYRIWIVFTASGTASRQMQLIVADTGENLSYNGVLGQASVQVFGGQTEDAACPSSLILTEASAVTRTADVLTYVGDDGNVPAGGGFLRASFMLPDQDDEDPYIAALSDGGSASERVVLLLGGDTSWSFIQEGVEGIVHSSEVAVDSSDGDEHDFELRYKIDSAVFKRDGTVIATDSDVAAIPDDLDTINVGAAQSSLIQTGGLITRLRIGA